MTLFYADPSAIVGAYLADQPDHAALRSMLFHGATPAVVSEIARVEVASSAMAAERGGRIPSGQMLISRFEADCAAGGSLKLLAFRGGESLTRAVRLMEEHRLYALDAIHLAVALEDVQGLAQGEEIVFVTRDHQQAGAARALGLTVA